MIINCKLFFFKERNIIKLFDQLVIELVDIQALKKGLTRQDIGIALNVSESFIKQVHSKKNNKHYNLYHLYMLSNEWRVDIRNFIPTKDNIKLTSYYKNNSELTLENINTEIISELWTERKNNG